MDIDSAYYSFCLTALVFLSGLVVSVRQYMWLSYCGQGLIFLLYFASLDGHLNLLLGLDANSIPMVSAILGSAACAFSYALCGLLLRKEHPLRKVTPVLLLLSGISLCSPLLLFVVSLDGFHGFLAGLFWLAIVAQVLPPITWFFLNDWARTIVMPLVVLICGAILLSGVIGDGAGALVPGGPAGIRRGLMIWITLSGAIAMLGMTGIIQRARIRNAERALEALRRELAAERAQQTAQRDMQRARELANLRGEQLANAAHDIKQPLVALRASAHELSSQSGKAPEELERAIDYVDRLATSYLTLSEENQALSQNVHSPQREEVVDAQLILSSMAAMFTSDAKARDIELSVVPSSLELVAPPIALMRVASNAVSNAIEHSAGQRILIGWRRRPSNAELWVIDNGKGLPDDLVGSAFTSGVRDKESNGHGLGLAIVEELTQQNDWQVTLSSSPTTGTALKMAGIKRSTGATQNLNH